MPGCFLVQEKKFCCFSEAQKTVAEACDRQNQHNIAFLFDSQKDDSEEDDDRLVPVPFSLPDQGPKVWSMEVERNGTGFNLKRKSKQKLMIMAVWASWN